MSYPIETAQAWDAPKSLAEAESALASQRLYGQATRAKFWLCRRNGKTQTWTRFLERGSVPIKAGLKSYGEITPDNLSLYRIQPSTASVQS